MSVPTEDDKYDLLVSCRYGDLEDVQTFIKQFGQDVLADIRDDNGNNVLHMAAGNGHGDVIDYLLPIIPSSLLATQNANGSTPLHWAAFNSHLDVTKKLVQYPGGPGIDLIDIKNSAGRSPLGEAEMTGWDEGAKWLVQMMKLDPEQGEAQGGAEEEEEVVSDQQIQLEIEDADGQIARMTLGGNSSEHSQGSASTTKQ